MADAETWRYMAKMQGEFSGGKILCVGNQTADFDADLFGRHILPLAAYVEPEGFAQLSEIKRPQTRHYDEFVPQASAIAESLFANIEQKGEWGAQYVTREIDGSYGAAWRTHNVAHQYPACGGRTRRGKELTARDVLRSLTRSDVYAVGRTDRHVLDLELGPFGNDKWRTTPVSVLCLDVDMDRAWAVEDAATIRRELTIESHLAIALGLPYRAFRTGGRGHQAVLPLPAPTDRSAATWLLTAYLSLLAPYHRQVAGVAKADAHNLQGIVRVAGGRHAGTERVAFWVDPSTAALYPIERQIELMRTGYCHPERGTPTAKAFADAASEISRYLFSRFHIQPHEYANPMVSELVFWASLEGLPDNPLVGVFRTAQEEWGLSDEDGTWEGTQMDAGRNDGATDDLAARLAATQPRVGQHVPAAEGTRAWAERIWAMDWPAPNLFWDWASEAGQRGITAAKVLFGAEGNVALDAMLARVDVHPISTTDPVKARTRKRVLRSLFKKHTMLPFLRRTAEGTDFSGEAFDHARTIAARTLSAEGAAIIPEIFARVHAVKRVQARCAPDIERIIEIILLAFEEYAERYRVAEAKGATTADYVELSLNDIVVAAVQRWPDAPPLDRSTARRHLKRLTSGEPECAFAILTEVWQSKEGILCATRYRMGEGLRETTFGSALPTSIAGENAPRSSPSGPLRIRVRGGVQYTHTAAKRGRKPLGSNADVKAGRK